MPGIAVDQSIDTFKQFEAALRDSGMARLRLDQIVTIYHKTFPTEAMRPDMRRRLHDTIVDMVAAGVVITEGEGMIDDDPLGLPQAIAMRGVA